MSEYAMYRMYDARQAELEHEARIAALVRGSRARRRWWQRSRRTDEDASGVRIPAQRVDEHAPRAGVPAHTADVAATSAADRQGESVRVGGR